MDRLKAVLDLYLAMDAETDANVQAQIYDPGNAPPDIPDTDRRLQDDLAEAILTFRGLDKVGDLAACECDDMRCTGLEMLIDSAADVYDQVDGFYDVMVGEGLYQPAEFAKIPPELDGCEFCEWLNENYGDGGDDEPEPEHVKNPRRDCRHKSTALPVEKGRRRATSE